MRNSILILLILVLSLGVLVYFKVHEHPNIAEVVSPIIKKIPLSTKAAQETPVPYTVNSSTDLKKELESINPEVKADDFKDLEILIYTHLGN